MTTQPDCWRRAAALAGRLAGALAPRGARVAVGGCGTSLFVGPARAALPGAGGHGETDAFAASELPAGRRYDLVVALSRSGTTTEVLEALDAVGAPATLAIIAVRPVPRAERCRRGGG